MSRSQVSFPELPYYLTVYKVVDKEKDRVHFEVESTIHVNRLVRLPQSYSIGYVTDKPQTTMAEVLSAIVRRYNLKLNEPKYS